MISRRRQAALRTLMPTLTERFRYACAAETSLRCAARIHFHQHPTSFFRFVGELCDERRPAGVVDRLGQHAAGKSFDVQIFDSDYAVFTDQPSTSLMVRISALVSDVRVCALQQFNRFAATMGAFLSPRYLSLRFAELPLCFAVESRILNLGPVRDRCKTHHTNIEANAFCAYGQRRGFAFYGEAGVPASRFALDSKRLNRPLKRPVQFDSHVSNLGQAQPAILEREPRLSVGERVVSSG